MVNVVNVKVGVVLGGPSCYDNPKNGCQKTKTVKDMVKMMKTNNKTNKKSNTKKTKKSFMSKLVFWK